MGSDLDVVNAARVSFNKASDWICACGEKEVWVYDDDYLYYCAACNTGNNLTLDKKDKRLINYLAKHNHWTPFAHCVVRCHVKAPIFVARQLFKHKQGFVENEVSRRYVDYEPEVYFPDEWRSSPEGNIKQGSGTDIVEIEDDYQIAIETALQAYANLLSRGVCPEQARIVLPQAMCTEWWWTGSLAAWARVFKLRTDLAAQKETRDLVWQLNEFMPRLFPISWGALTNLTH